MNNIIYRVFGPKYHGKVYSAQLLEYEQEQKPKVKNMKAGHVTAVTVQEVAMVKILALLCLLSQRQ